MSVLFSINSSFVSAHTAGGPIDAAGNNASATDLGSIQCSNDGTGDAKYLVVSIEDQSSPVNGLLLSAQIMKNNHMINVTDPVSGDGKPSASVSLAEGNGPYQVSVNKTAAGVRNFVLTYHCLTESGDHTGTDIFAYQLQ